MIEETLYTTLKNHAGTAALVGLRIYPRRAPQGATFPHLVYNRVSGARVTNLDGDSIENPRIQLDCWAESYNGAKSLAAQVEAAMRGMKTVLSGDRDDSDDEAGLYNVSMDYSVWSA
jgi:hypothetical protein